MGNSTLHAIAINELRYSSPDFYQEYCLLIEGISAQIRELAKNQADHLDYSSFTESYDRASYEPVLQVVIGIQKTELYIHIYIHKDNYFVIGKSGSGKVARTAKQALDLVMQKLNEMGAG
jgi:hypothetical protein